jgi:hypothetical protein
MDYLEDCIEIETMSDYVHRCLKCNCVSIEIEKHVYKCLTCEFEWEIKYLV